MEVRETENRKYAAANRLAKRRRKKIRVAVLLVSVFALLIGVLIILSCTVFFPIHSIKVSGGTIYESTQIIDISGIKLGDKLFGISEKKARENLTVKLPYIKDVQLKRNLFDNIEIVVTETADAYCYSQNGKYYTADTDNKALAVFDTKPQGITEIIISDLPQITLGYNIDISAESLETANNICGILKRAEIGVDSLDISKTSEITALVEGRFTVNFGTLQDIEQKAEHLSTEIPHLNEQHGTEVTGTIMLDSWTSSNRLSTFRKDEKF